MSKRKLLLPLFLFFTLVSYAQVDNLGTDFWVMFNHNNSDYDVMTIYITGPSNTSGTIEIPGLSFTQNFTFLADEVVSIQLPASAEVQTCDVVEDKGVHIISNEEVAVYGLNQAPASTDGYLAYPTDAMGTDYLVMSYENSGIVNGSAFGITGLEDNTTITITPTETIGVRIAGIPYDITLNEGQTYQLKENLTNVGDLTGTEIVADKPISVFGFHSCANIPDGTISYCDHLTEQLLPESTWGDQIITVPLASRTAGDIFRVLSSTDNTDISLNGSVIATLNRGEFTDLDLASITYNVIEGSNPISVAHYSKGSQADNVTSDPFMTILTAVDNFGSSTSFTTPTVVFTDNNWINVVVPNAEVGNLILDGVAIPFLSYTVIGSSGYSGAQVSIAQGEHKISGNFNFGAYVYGYASNDSYGYPLGLFAEPIAEMPETAVPTLSQWSVIALGLLLMIFGVVMIRQRQTIIAS